MLNKNLFQASAGKSVKPHYGIISLLFSILFIIFLYVQFHFYWETNDDVGMSMVAHGYGIADYGSSYIVFSNILWGFIVHNFPTITGVLGYSLATLLVLLLISWQLLYFLLRLQIGYVPSLLVTVLLLVRPIVFPQFTVSAGLLMVVAIVGWQLYARDRNTMVLLSACSFAFLSFLIRNQEFLLVLGVGLPLLPWRIILQDKQFKLAIFILIAAIIFAQLLNSHLYNVVEWQYFLNWNLVRFPFTDFNIGQYLQGHEKAMRQYGFSMNDVDLIHNWFFADIRVSDAQRLTALLTNLKISLLPIHSVEEGMLSVKAIFSPLLLPLSISAIILSLLLRLKSSLLLMWGLFLASIFLMGLMGRPGMIRVYVPLLSLLILAPILLNVMETNLYKTKLLILLIAIISVVHQVKIDSANNKQMTKLAQKDLNLLPKDETIVVWGGLPFEKIFPVLSNDTNLRLQKFYALGVFTYAPFSVAVANEKQATNGFTQRLMSKRGVLMVVSEENIDNFKKYCIEHWQGTLRQATVYAGSTITLKRFWCVASN